ncbi:hypothetical protein CMUS01_02334 [Colletotrichum musicola]|uniref:Uncharacterized protein n=1 Tax=Colletotrichum musicola TaxID=2175873 RepID=A0A8H6U786_9PEZI|nr:hypothetical protein CMUS01_02334 [Colletotrichum musicola]
MPPAKKKMTLGETSSLLPAARAERSLESGKGPLTFVRLLLASPKRPLSAGRVPAAAEVAAACILEGRKKWMRGTALAEPCYMGPTVGLAMRKGSTRYPH